MNTKRYKFAIFLIVALCSLIFAQQIDRILPYTNYDTTGVYIIFDGDIKYEKQILQSPPSISLIFPNTKLTEGNHHKSVELPPLYKIEAKETISNKYYKHTNKCFETSFSGVVHYFTSLLVKMMKSIIDHCGRIVHAYEFPIY